MGFYVLPARCRATRLSAPSTPCVRETRPARIGVKSVARILQLEQQSRMCEPVQVPPTNGLPRKQADLFNVVCKVRLNRQRFGHRRLVLLGTRRSLAPRMAVNVRPSKSEGFWLGPFKWL